MVYPKVASAVVTVGRSRARENNISCVCIGTRPPKDPYEQSTSGGRVVIVVEHWRRRPLDVKSCGNEVAAFAAWHYAQMTIDILLLLKETQMRDRSKKGIGTVSLTSVSRSFWAIPVRNGFPPVIENAQKCNASKSQCSYIMMMITIITVTTCSLCPKK